MTKGEKSGIAFMVLGVFVFILGFIVFTRSIKKPSYTDSYEWKVAQDSIRQLSADNAELNRTLEELRAEYSDLQEQDSFYVKDNATIVYSIKQINAKLKEIPANVIRMSANDSSIRAAYHNFK